MPNLRELLDEYRIPFREHGESPHVTEGWIGVVCPFCGTASSNYGLGINLKFNNCTCWKCGRHRLGDVIAAATGLPIGKILPSVKHLDRSKIPDRIGSGKLEMPDGVGPLLPAHRRYLSDRGFDPDELVETWKIGGIGLAAVLAWRIYIPVHHRGSVVSWTTRAIGDAVSHHKRYRSAERGQESYPRSNVLYGANNASHAIVICEGPTDAWALGPGGCCTFGIKFSSGQIRAASKFPVRVIAFDRGTEEGKQSRKLAKALEAFPGETHLVELEGKDVASSPREARELRDRFLK